MLPKTTSIFVDSHNGTDAFHRGAETMDSAYSFFEAVVGGMSARIWPLYLPGMILLAYWAYRTQKQGGGFWRWLFPKEIYLHKSHWVDIQLFIVGRLLSLLGAFQIVGIATVFAATIIGVLGGTMAQTDSMSPVLVTFLLVLASDFAVYWVHRVHHEQRVLWPFHSVHHSAEVMTPITVYRKHPIYDLISSSVKGALLGIAQGVLLSFFVSEISLTLILGANAFYFVFNSITANLRHSHVWISFGRVAEHIFISPAQHQIHHSSELKHYNKNYGEVFAIWDWMFGTLYISEEQEILQFGIGDEHGHKIDQPHPSLVAALIEPLKESYNELRGIRKTAEQVTPAE